MTAIKNKKETLEIYNTDISSIRCTFLGRPMTQTFAVLHIFEKLFLKYNFKRIVEFGTWRGALSLYFLLYCLGEKAEFVTYDTKKFNSYFDNNKKDILHEVLSFGKHFRQKDIFEHEEEIKSIIQKEGRTIIYCDNGDKIREFNMFVPHLKKDDIIGVHDWNKEIQLDDIKETIKKNGLKMILEKDCIKYDKKVRFFKKNE